MKSMDLRKKEKRCRNQACHFTTLAIPWYDSPYIHNHISREMYNEETEEEIAHQEKELRKEGLLKCSNVFNFMPSFAGELIMHYFTLSRHKSKYFVLRNKW